jgi:phosphatidylglycerol:prolipoprotein diacylglycerol transferase
MRQVLFRIPWDGIPLGGMRLPIFGLGVLLLLWIAAGVKELYDIRRETGQWRLPDVTSGALWLIVAAVLWQAPAIGARLAPEGFPLFGYGAMLLIGLVCSVGLALRRARQEGFPNEVILDLAVWLFLAGIAGGRIFYLVQHGDRAFAKAKTVPEVLFAVVNLSEGGLVLFGAMIGGAIAHFAFCHRRQLPALQLADVITPSIFIGVGFGRIGCLLNGCCFGDGCDLPWGIVFPADSVPTETLIHRGFLPPDAAGSPPLHPSQIYSAIDGFLIAGLTLWYHRYRRRPGDVLGLALLITPVTRFLIEFVRGDEFGQWGTSLTISQWISLAMFAVALGFQAYLSTAASHRTGGIAP